MSLAHREPLLGHAVQHLLHAAHAVLHDHIRAVLRKAQPGQGPPQAAPARGERTGAHGDSWREAPEGAGSGRRGPRGQESRSGRVSRARGRRTAGLGPAAQGQAEASPLAVCPPGTAPRQARSAALPGTLPQHQRVSAGPLSGTWAPCAASGRRSQPGPHALEELSPQEGPRPRTFPGSPRMMKLPPPQPGQGPSLRLRPESIPPADTAPVAGRAPQGEEGRAAPGRLGNEGTTERRAPAAKDISSASPHCTARPPAG